MQGFSLSYPSLVKLIFFTHSFCFFSSSRAWDELSFHISTALVIVISVATMYSALLHYSHSCTPSSFPIHSSYSFYLSIHLTTKPLILGLFIYCTLQSKNWETHSLALGMCEVGFWICEFHQSYSKTN